MTPEKIAEILRRYIWINDLGVPFDIILAENIPNIVKDIIAMPKESEYCPNSMTDVLFKSECNCCEPNAMPEESVIIQRDGVADVKLTFNQIAKRKIEEYLAQDKMPVKFRSLTDFIYWLDQGGE